VSVYVDNARIPAQVGRYSGRWSHLTADTETELRAFAARLGLPASWWQTCKTSTACQPAGRCVHWHIDITDRHRTAALAAGAIPIDVRDWAAITATRRAQLTPLRGVRP
jgi:hypothetical protein